MNTVQHDFLTLIQTRRSVRAYKPDPVPADLLDAVLEAGTWAPTGGGRQSPTIVAVTDPAARRQIAALNARVMGQRHRPLLRRARRGAGARRRGLPHLCGGRQLRAGKHHAGRPRPGLGTVWVHREREIFDSEEGKALLRAWHLPEDACAAVGAVALGYPGRGARRTGAAQGRLHRPHLTRRTVGKRVEEWIKNSGRLKIAGDPGRVNPLRLRYHAGNVRRVWQRDAGRAVAGHLEGHRHEHRHGVLRGWRSL